MANIDVCSYFFTAAIPVCNEGIVEHDGLKSSPIHVVRQVLETLPTALQSHATQEIGINSPFSRNLRTHFTRFIVLDQPYFNGRDHSNALVNAAMGTNLLAPQPVDQIPCPYILWTIDFDLLEPAGEGEPARYLEELWRQMEPELRSIFQYCYAFDTVTDAPSFARYMMRCQVETTMPFHDYWYVPPKLKSISIPGLAAIPVIGLVLLAGTLIAWLLRLTGWAWAAGFAHWSGWSWAPWAGIALVVIGVAIGYYRILRWGARPFPAAPGADLRHVLKCLYLQQAFTRFAIAQQHRDPAEWGAAFRRFLELHRPADLDGPTQPAGVIRSTLSEDAA
ncbi:hypothetical protein DMC47_07320 [Nostoc sp. 3335mG]|nr:hypothetical protein DMC47_07320 [Nostoc sp. 3335mG]